LEFGGGESLHFERKRKKKKREDLIGMKTCQKDNVRSRAIRGGGQPVIPQKGLGNIRFTRAGREMDSKGTNFPWEVPRWESVMMGEKEEINTS